MIINIINFRTITLASLNVETSEFVANNASKSLNDLDSSDIYLEQERKMLEMFEKRKKEEDAKKLVQQQTFINKPTTVGSSQAQSHNPFNQPLQTTNNNTRPSDDLMLLSMNPSVFQQPRFTSSYTSSNKNFKYYFSNIFSFSDQGFNLLINIFVFINHKIDMEI